MTDLPILCAAPVVRNLLAGRQSQDRRPAWGKPMPGLYESDGGPLRPILRPSPWQKVKAGDRLWVRENWATWGVFDDLAPSKLTGREGLAYPASWDDDKGPIPGKIRPSIHMPRWASRLTLVVTEVRRQHVQDISEEDARAEGIRWVGCDGGRDFYSSWTPEPGTRIEVFSPSGLPTAREAFAVLWESLYSRLPGQSWAENPEVVAMTFITHKVNIDQMEARAA